MKKQSQIQWVKNQLLKGEKVTEKNCKARYPNIKLSAVISTLYNRDGMDIVCYQDNGRVKGYYCLEG